MQDFVSMNKFVWMYDCLPEFSSFVFMKKKNIFFKLRYYVTGLVELRLLEPGFQQE